ncbi:hypothetical protein [Streptomyces sp. NBC_01240]|uniref:hypothetical protein n=1 Tax=Streptomyces sp. NBC_01240 TaxID=2903793 RepID=UPI002E0FC8F1|nr:hypothetical protein OG466_40900 [Streptomyces sp. NBC_01240]
MAADVFEQQFTQIHNALFRDRRLSFKAKGIFGLISTHRDGFGVSEGAIASFSTDGVSAVSSGLKELILCRYLQRERKRDELGRLGEAEYYITDMPDGLVISFDPGFDPLQHEDLEAEETRRSEPTCENRVQADPGSLPSSEPTCDFPEQDHPVLENRPHKKTIPQNINEKNTTSPSRPPIQLVPELAEGPGGGGNAPQQQDQDLVRAAEFVDLLPYRGRLPGPKQRASLIEGVAAAFAGGWTDVRLHKQLTEETSNAKSLAAVYRHRLAPENLPAAPSPASPVPAQRPRVVVDDSAGKRPECDDCGRYIPVGSTSTICIDCRPDAAYA